MTTVTVVIAGVVLLAAALVAAGSVVLRARWRRINARSRAARAWAPGAGEELRAGGLAVRVAGDPAAAEAVVLLHGLASSGTYFGAAWDELATVERRLVVPDLLGFGHSLDRARGADSHAFEHHVAALRACIDEVVAPDARLVIGAHSMGCLPALGLADELGERVDAVVLFGPQLHDSVEDAERFVARRGWFARHFTLDRRVAHATCRTVCPRPWLATPLARLVAPTLPVALADRTRLHSWDSYVGSLRAFLGHRGWRDSLAHLHAGDARVIVCAGDRDHTIDRGVLAQLADDELVELRERSGSGHQLPLTDSPWCVKQVLAAGAASMRPA